MVRAGLTVLLADLVMVSAAFLVLQDVQMRIDCSLAECQPLTRTSAGFTYSILSKSFSVAVNGRTLVSPPIFDWFQALIVGLVVLNAWYGYQRIVRGGKRSKESRAQIQAPEVSGESGPEPRLPLHFQADCLRE